MARFYSVLQAIRTASYSEKTQLLEYTVKLIHYMNQSGQSLLQEDRSALMKFCDEAVSDLLDAHLVVLGEPAEDDAEDDGHESSADHKMGALPISIITKMATMGTMKNQPSFRVSLKSGISSSGRLPMFIFLA